MSFVICHYCCDLCIYTVRVKQFLHWQANVAFVFMPNLAVIHVYRVCNTRIKSEYVEITLILYFSLTVSA
ncbi:hypothetical protein NP493_405g02009 [Ridgeia piscesae]|uniref:Uncharacterized protein n=1 Tax=Ridgeia piscesae TaxID=27915 RepID=A0AAD9L0S6_RIDPI|nr:hypothetical protein NP493_405g02009 [Ridgeia piscesae]